MIMPLPGNVRGVGQIGEYIEIMLEAMYLHKKIQFQYTEINNAMEKVLRKEGKMYQLNLYTIYWSDNNYYLMQQNTDSNPRFPFDAYQRQKWDIEHIHSVTTDRAQNKKEREEWLEEAKPYIDSEVGMPEDLKAEIDNIYTKKLYEDESAPQYDEMYNKVIAFFSGESSVEEKPINEISNLTLLDQRTNRGYGNHIFPVKRNKILEKSGIESFIPLCTKNVFLKFYSKTVSQMYLWDKHDRQDYFDKMVQTIVDYLAEDIEDMKEEI